MGAVVAGIDGEHAQRMRDFGKRLGLAFQVLDDLLDVLAEREEAGKDVGCDGGKPSMVRTIGLEEAQREARQHIAGAASLVAHADGASGLLGDFALSLMTSLQSNVKFPHAEAQAG
jgi:geranylgeranyl diphosphate synthase type II